MERQTFNINNTEHFNKKQDTNYSSILDIFIAISFIFLLAVLVLTFEQNMKWGIIFGFMIFVYFFARVYDMIDKTETITTIGVEGSQNKPLGFSAIPNSWIFWGSIIFFFIYTFFVASGYHYNIVVGAPQFNTAGFTFNIAGLQSMLYGDFLNAILSAFAGIAETIFFFGFVFPSIISNLVHKFRLDKIIAVIIGVIIVSSIFTIFHLAVYGLNEVALLNLFVFAIFNCIILSLLHNIFPLIAWHSANNLGLSQWVHTFLNQLENIL